MNLFACLIGRLFSVFPLGWIANKLLRREKENKLSWKELEMMWFSGLRGPVAFALAYRISEKAIPDEEDRKTIITSTLLIIWITSFILGGLSTKTLQCLDLAKIGGPPE